MAGVMTSDIGPSMPQGSTTTTQQRSETQSTPTWFRQARQLGFFFAGAGLMAASVAVSRRAVLRRKRDTFPRFYTSNRDGPKFDSSDRSLMAAEALGLATLNVMSFGALLVGGIAWAFDLSSVDDLRARSQAAMRRNGPVNISPEDEAQMEAIMNDLLAKVGMEKQARTDQREDSKKKDST